jgi:hypothetical protein
MKAYQLQARPRHQRGQPLHELQRAHDHMRAPISPRRLELERHLPGGAGLHWLVRQHRSGDVADRASERQHCVHAAAAQAHATAQSHPRLHAELRDALLRSPTAAQMAAPGNLVALVESPCAELGRCAA